MKNLIYSIVAVLAIAFLQSCSDQDNLAEEVHIIDDLSHIRIDTVGDPDGGASDGDGSCDLTECTGPWLPHNFVTTWALGSSDNPCELCAWVIVPEGVTGELCVSLTQVDNLDDGLQVFVDDISFSGSVSSGDRICYPLDSSLSFDVTMYFITDQGCARIENGRDRAICSTCCEDENASVNFTEIGTDINYQTLCGKINVALDTDCPGPFTWSYYPEPGTGLKGSGQGTGSYFDIYAQDDCGLLGPGHYTVTFTDGECFEHTESYYFEPCNTELYDPANPSVMQMTDLRLRCMSYGLRFTAFSVAKCCSCTGSDVSIKITNGDGLETTVTGGVTMEAGCQPAESYFKKIMDYDPNEWTDCCNKIEVYDCEDNLIFTKENVDDPCL